MYFGIGRTFREKAEFSRHPPPEFPRCQLPHKATKIRNYKLRPENFSRRKME